MRSARVLLLLPFVACSGRQQREMSPGMERAMESGRLVKVARLGLHPQDPPGFEDLRAAFTARNAGYGLAWHPGARGLPAAASTRIAFVQGGKTRARVSRTGAPEEGAGESDLGLGDLVVLRPGEGLVADAAVDLVVFTVPEAPGAGVPAVIRPDLDPKITDTPGGCATDPGAYRRLLLTWNPERGPYVFHALNAHRIRADDSVTHYHPEQGGFDEFYLVQEAPPGSKFLFCYERELLARHQDVTHAQAQDLMHTRERLPSEPEVGRGAGSGGGPEGPAEAEEGTAPGLLPGDLIYIPRGVVHRGLGGIVAQIIAVPGFVPGGEVGVDAELQAINERLGLAGHASIPFHEGR